MPGEQGDPEIASQRKNSRKEMREAHCAAPTDKSSAPVDSAVLFTFPKPKAWFHPTAGIESVQGRIEATTMQEIDFRPVLLAWASLQAKELGARKCARKGVGGLIRQLHNHIDAGLPDMYGASAARAVRLLEAHCRYCGKCGRANIRLPADQAENRPAG